MKRVILDTNIYGFLAIDPKKKSVVEKILSSVVVYGVDVIRKELRATPKGFVDGINLRNDLIRLFDDLVKKSYEITPEMMRIAENYYTAYKEFGGFKPKQKIFDDFLIVACASVHNIDVVVSDDNKTLVSDEAVKAYRVINPAFDKKLPQFIDYEKFKRSIS